MASTRSRVSFGERGAMMSGRCMPVCTYDGYNLDTFRIRTFIRGTGRKLLASPRERENCVLCVLETEKWKATSFSASGFDPCFDAQVCMRLLVCDGRRATARVLCVLEYECRMMIFVSPPRPTVELASRFSILHFPFSTLDSHTLGCARFPAPPLSTDDIAEAVLQCSEIRA